MSAFLRYIVEIGEHLATEMREDNAFRLDLTLMGGDVGIVEMEADWFSEEVALRDEQIGAIGQCRHVLCPFAVALYATTLPATSTRIEVGLVASVWTAGNVVMLRGPMLVARKRGTSM
jgi:hypothetical protein